jgi:hypothetical protein
MTKDWATKVRLPAVAEVSPSVTTSHRLWRPHIPEVSRGTFPVGKLTILQRRICLHLTTRLEMYAAVSPFPVYLHGMMNYEAQAQTSPSYFLFTQIMYLSQNPLFLHRPRSFFPLRQVRSYKKLYTECLRRSLLYGASIFT